MEDYEGKLITDPKQDGFLSYSCSYLNNLEEIKKNGIDYFPDENFCEKNIIKINVRDKELSNKLSSETFSCYQNLREIVTHHYMLPEIKEMVDKKGRLLEKLEETNKERKRYNTFKNSLKIGGNIFYIENIIREEDLIGKYGSNSHSKIKSLSKPSKLEWENKMNKEFFDDTHKTEIATEFYRLVCENILLLDFIKKYFHAYYTKSSDFMLRLFLQLEEGKKALNVATRMIDSAQNFNDPEEVAKWELDEDSENEETNSDLGDEEEIVEDKEVDKEEMVEKST